MKKLLLKSLPLTALWASTYAFCDELKDSVSAHKGALEDSSLTSAQGLLQWVLSTIVVIGILLFIAFILKRMKLIAPRSTKSMQIISQLSLGPKERVVHIKVYDKEILVGVSSQNVNYLCEVYQDDFVKEAQLTRAKALFDKAMQDEIKTNTKESQDVNKSETLGSAKSVATDNTSDKTEI